MRLRLSNCGKASIRFNIDSEIQSEQSSDYSDSLNEAIARYAAFLLSSHGFVILNSGHLGRVWNDENTSAVSLFRSWRN